MVSGGKKILLIHPQQDRRHETTTNRKSVKHWSSDCIGGIPRVSLLSYDDINEAVCVKKEERSDSWFLLNGYVQFIRVTTNSNVAANN